MIDPTDLPTLKARLRDLLERAHPRPWLYRGKSDSIHVAPSEPPYQYGPGFLQLNGYDDDECKEADVDLIVEGINALPALLDELDRAESESALCKRFAEQNVEELNADELREYAIGLGERVARNEREMAAANGRLRARHAEEVEGLRRERDELRAQREELRSAISRQATRHMQRVERLESELTARRALDADVVACAEQCRNILIGPPGMPVEDYPLAPVAFAARRILAALDSHECPKCHRNSDHKMSCSRGGSKGGRFGVRLNSQGGEGE